MINKHFMIIGLTATLLVAGSNEIFSNYNLDEALAIGKTEGKPVLVKFHADWCHFCQKMDRETFTDKNVKSAMTNFIPVKINVDTKEGLDLARRFGVTALPTIILFGPDGNKIYHQPGFHSAKQMEKVLNKIHG